MPTETDTRLRESVDQFLTAFEAVFHTDWEYSRRQLGMPSAQDAHSAEAALLRVLGEHGDASSADGTFLKPGDTDTESLNWGNYTNLLRRYHELRDLVPPAR